MLVLLAAVATGAVAQTTYKVSVKEGTEDATSWQGKAGEGEYQALPLEGVAAGTAVSVKYNGTKKVKSVKAKKKAAAVPEYYNKLTKINDNFSDQVFLLKQLGRGRQAYNSSLTAAQAYALATYQASIDGRPVYVIMSSLDNGYEIHYAVSTDASATEHTAGLYDLCSESNPVRMYYVAQ